MILIEELRKYTKKYNFDQEVFDDE